MLIKRPSDIAASEITPEAVYVNRRQFIEGASLLGVAAALAPSALAGESRVAGPQEEELTSLRNITTYNNFYEFGTDKRDPSQHSGDFKPTPWAIRVEGHCEKPGTYSVEDLVPRAQLQERVYRMRCVEGWSMVIPWMGVPLHTVLDRLQPTSAAKFVAFETVTRPAEMPGQRTGVLDWPYVEGLRMDEARNDLALLVTGLYGQDLMNQNGAPVRLVVPWKYGFKGIKSIVRISLVETMPPTTWNIMAPEEYGFYANVNPEVDHPRWSQARERRIGEFRRRPTLMFNGYGQQVAHMYAGLDLTRWY